MQFALDVPHSRWSLYRLALVSVMGMHWNGQECLKGLLALHIPSA
jgi:hypothetical protein